MTFRGFIAAEVPGTPAMESFAAALRQASNSLKVIPLDRVHLTLKFLGDTEEGLIPDIVAAIRAVCAGIAPIDLQLRGTGAFPNLSRMNVVWVGVEGAEALRRIAAGLEASLEPLGFPRERRPWRAHVTVARVKGRRDLDRVRRLLESHAMDDFGDHRVESVHLKKSVLTPEGAVYSTLESIRLPAD